ncbi:hypothetical protein F4604DRAFT_1950522 [Suillus subluteus]|nr:hypothetical protein F4604DRAFT_1950522 [Suillus subluteus]
MMDRADEATKARCLDWSTSFKQDCSVLYAAAGVTDLAASGDIALTAGNYDRAIELYSAAIDLDFATDTIFANRSKARSRKMLWYDALLNAEKVIELSPSSYFGYQSKHVALHGAHRYDEAIELFKIMLSKLENAPDTQTQYAPNSTSFNIVSSLSKLAPTIRQSIRSILVGVIQEIMKAQLGDAPHCLLNTFTAIIYVRYLAPSPTSIGGGLC